MATITANVGAAGNWTANGSWVGGVAPTAADDAVIPLATTSITIDAGALCRSADFNTFTGTITGGATGTLTIGDATAGASNIAFRLPTGATFAPTSGFIMTFVSTSATLQSIIIGTYSLRNVTFNSPSNGNYAFTNAITGSSMILTHTKGTLHMDGLTDNAGLSHLPDSFFSTNTNVRALLLGNATIGVTGGQSWDITNSTNMTLTAGGSTIRPTGGSMTFQSGGLTYNIVDFAGPTNCTLSGGGTFATLKRTGSNNKTSDFIITNNITVTSSLVFAGDSVTNRVFVRSATLGTFVSITSTGVTNTWSNVDLRDVGLTTAYDASGITGGCGLCGGTSAITGTTAATQTWSGTVSGNWSTNAWTTRVPLPQDDVVISSAFSASQTVSADMPRLGKSIDFSGSSGSPTFNPSGGPTLYGSLNLTNISSTAVGSIIFENRTTSSITSAGATFSGQVDLRLGTYTLQDAFSSTSAFRFNSAATFNSGNFNITSFDFGFSNSSAITMNLGSSVITVTGTGTIVGLTGTINAGTSKFIFTDVSVSAKTFGGGGKTFYDFQITGGGAGTVTITGANTFNRITVPGGTKSIILPGSTTTTFLNQGPLGNGTNLITFTASAGSATVAQTSGVVNWDYISLTNIPASGTALFYAGPLSHSTDGGGNTNWIFSSYPAGGGGGGRMSTGMKIALA